jgi:type IV pilus assembly protein PilA
MPNPCRRQAGFTLIELMVVVAIVGILVVIAIPNFLRYQMKTRQAEAKVNLAGIFVAELAYYGENSRFGSFSEIIYSLIGPSNRYTYRSGAAGAAGGPSTESENIDLHSASLGTATPENSIIQASNGPSDSRQRRRPTWPPIRPLINGTSTT